MSIARLAALLLCLAFCGRSHAAFAWGSSGHSAVAELAQRLIADETRRQIAGLLGDASSLASISNWADTIAEQRPQTRTWHYVNIPYDAAGYDAARDCPGADGGHCVVAAITRLRAVLADPSAARDVRAEALRFLVHFVADAHQPLHCAQRNHDNGGTTQQVTFHDHTTSLHKLWDFELLDSWSFDWGEHVSEMQKQLPVEMPAVTDPVQWVNACQRLAVEVAYDLPPGNVIDAAYEQRARPAIYRQLGLAGVRLGKLLDDALR